MHTVSVMHMTTTETLRRLSWWRNGRPRKVLGGRYTQWEGTTQARAICTCGWRGSLFSTRQVEAYRVVGNREFNAHVCVNDHA
jgi:hypothetical protein